MEKIMKSVAIYMLLAVLPVTADCFAFASKGSVEKCCLSMKKQSEFDISYTPVANPGAEDGERGWFTSSAESVAVQSPEGDRCFKLSSNGDSHSELRTGLFPIRKGEKIKLKYFLKTDTHFSADNSYIAVRSYDSDKETAISEKHFAINNTKGQWSEFEKVTTVDDEAYYIDIRVMLNPRDGENTIYLDSISLFREISYQPFYDNIQPLSEGDTLFVYDKEQKGPASNDEEFIAVQTLQGVSARTERPMIWINTGDYSFRNYLADNFNIRFNEKYAEDFPGLLEELKPYTSGRYVLYDMDDKPSITAATTLAGLYDAVAIETSLEQTAIEKGYTKAIDAGGKNCKWVYENYREQLNDRAIIVHTNNKNHHPSAAYLRDWGPALKALDWWYDDEDYSREVYSSMAPVSPVYGWQDPTTEDEGLSVKMHSEEGLVQVPSDWMVNFSVRAALGEVMKDKTFTQKIERKKAEKEDSVHYVTFILSDMDNILTEAGPDSFYSDEKFYRNEHRGEFPMTWGMAPALAELSPGAVDLWYNNATHNDIFISYCGLGYSYPSVSPYNQTHARRLSELMKRTDLRNLLIIDRVLPDDELDSSYYEDIKWFSSLDQVEGLFYLEYVRYAPHNGRIFWFDGKPMVTARFDFRSNDFYSAVRTNPQSLAESINELPADPESPEGYTFVTVHAWSKGLDDVYETIQLLDDDVRVVNAEQFIKQIRLNMGDKK